MLKPPSVILALALVLGLCGCGGSNQCVPFTLQANTPAGMLLVGKPEELFVGPSLDYAGVCQSVEGAAIIASQIEVFDPDQQPVMLESTQNDKDKTGVTLRFTPTKVGRYHFFIGFDPIGGIQQFDLLAAQDRASEPPLHQLPQRCETLESTRSGAWICGTNVFRGTNSPQQLPFGRVEAVGDVVWVVTSAQVLRYVDTGEKLELTASIAHSSGMPESIRATENDVAVAHTSSIQLFTFDGSTLSHTEGTRWLFLESLGPVGSDGPRGLLFRTGDRLTAVQNLGAPEASFQACAFQLTAGRFVRTSAPCQSLEGFVVGFEPQSVWTTIRADPTGPPSMLRRLEWTGEEFVQTASLALPDTLNLAYPLRLLRSSVLPVLRPNFPFVTLQGRSAVPVYVPGDPLLRLMHMDAELSSVQASSSFFWGNVINDRMDVLGSRIRAITPSP
ncbi:hypothetical protein [Hyalangium minutum]|uniref:Putative lipoprotein n=1 Tax=Hyalangium minutum TaxID=394096 RepID=A0A085W8C1_9BACT|nr:hypothetical protein [Hyalangium minutum]KFE63934.1 putative lipoprotein [Hyalangium minutum]